MEVILFTHTHWDREWYKPFQDFRIRLCEVIEQVLEELSSGSTDYFYLDGQTIVLEDYLKFYPEKAGQIIDLIRDKKLFIGPWYVLADEFLVSGESLIRNLLIGITQSRHYGCNDFFGYLPDSFGHNSLMPQILSSFGIERAVLWRGAGDRKSEFIWESGDGSQILATHLIEGYFQDIFHGEMPVERKAGQITGVLKTIKERTISDKLLLPIGGDHLGPVAGLKDLMEELNKRLPGYELKQGRINEYFSSLSLPLDRLERVKTELRDNSGAPVLPGTLSSRLYLKQVNARSTWLLSRIAEPLQSLLAAAGLAKTKKNELDYAWKLLLKNHPHDSICGCSVDEVHQENLSRFRQADQISNAIIDRCKNQLAGMVSRNSLVVCNLSNYEYSGLVSIKTSDDLPEGIPYQLVGSSVEFPREILLDTQRAPFCEDMKEFREYLAYVENIPSFSVKPLPASGFPAPVEVSRHKISNSLVEISINPDGSLYLADLTDNKMYKDLHIITDRADLGDTYNYAPLIGDKAIRTGLISSEITESGPLRGTIKLTYRISIPKYFDYETNSRGMECQETIITTKIILSSGSKRVEFDTSWENHSENHIMQVKFNLPEPVTRTVSENTFGLITREFGPDYRIENYIPAAKGAELAANSAPMQRFVFAQGLGIITEGLPEYVTSKNTLAITILRSTGKLSELAPGTRNFPAGPALDTPGAQCLGKHSARYAICPVHIPQELFKEADEFMGSVFALAGRAAQTSPLPENLVKISNKNILAYALKNPENRNINGFIVRLFNTSQESETVNFSSNIELSGFTETNPLEEVISENYDMTKGLVFRAGELKNLLFHRKQTIQVT